MAGIEGGTLIAGTAAAADSEFVGIGAADGDESGGKDFVHNRGAEGRNEGVKHAGSCCAAFLAH